jgi:hypothetical protein
MKHIAVCMLMGALLGPCSGDDDDDPPPPANNIHNNPQVVNTQQPTQIMITVAASSTPPGATVTGGGRQLGITPFQTQVPIPAPQPGQPPQSFQFAFALEGYQPATMTATPVNNTISITAALAPIVQPTEVAVNNVQEGGDDEGGDGGPEITVQGHGGGPIFDNHITTGTANVDQPCIIDRLRVRINGTHTFMSDMIVTLRGPGGSYTLQNHGRANVFRTHIVRRAVGDQAQGRWVLSINDNVGQDAGVLRGWSLGLRCRS